MKIIAEGCRLCEPLVEPTGERENDLHVSVRFDDSPYIFVDGDMILDASEAWGGSPGRVIRCDLENKGPRLCTCQPPYQHEMDEGSSEMVGIDHGVFWQLVEYDTVEIRPAA